MRGVIAMIALLATLVGCGPKIRGDRIDPLTKEPVLRYHAAKDLVVVDATVTTKVTRGLVDDTPFNVAYTNIEAATLGKVSLRAVPDHTRTYGLELLPGGTADQTLKVSVHPNGMPKSIGLTADDKSGQILGNVVKFAARVAAATAGFPAAGITGVPGVGQKELVELRDRRKLADAEWHRLVTKTREVQLAIEGEADADKRAALEAQLKSVQEALVKATALRTALTAEFEAELVRFTNRNGLGTATEERVSQHTFELTEIPTHNGLFSSVSEVDAALAQHPTMKRLWDDAGVALTIATPPAPEANAPPSGTAYPFSPTARAKDVTRIYYRRTRTVEVCVYVREEVAREGKGAKEVAVRLLSRTAMEVLHPDDEPVSVAFKPKSFSNQNLTVGFDDGGHLVTMDQGGTSAIAGFTDALAGASSSVLTEFSQQLTTAKGIQESKRAMSTSELADATARQTAETQEINARIALIEAQRKLEEALAPKK